MGYTAAVKNMKEAFEEYENGQLLYEGFFDKVKKIYSKFISFLSNLFSKVKEFVTSSVKNMQDFLGLEPVVKFKNEVAW